MRPSKTGEWLGDCEILEPLALGAHGEIVLARTGGAGGELVAVKRLLPELIKKAEAVTQFFDEIRLCTRLVHPNIVRVYRGDVHRDQPYIVMEFVDGVTLWDLIERVRDRWDPFPIPIAVHIATMLGDALDYAHSLRDERNRPLRLVHRDVSSVNVMVSFDGVVKLLDFGIARSTIREHETAPGIIRGKPQYLSPEQCGQGEIDRLTDIYSLGVVLYEMLGGQRPFVDDDVYQLIRSILRGEREALGELRPEVDPDLEEIVDRAMAVARDERYQSARQLVRDLRAYSASHPPAGSTADLAGLVRALFPDRLERVVGRYGPPETTAVDTVVPEAQDDGARAAVPPPRRVAAAPAEIDTEPQGLADPPTRRDVVPPSAAPGIAEAPAPSGGGGDQPDETTTELLRPDVASSARARHAEILELPAVEEAAAPPDGGRGPAPEAGLGVETHGTDATSREPSVEPEEAGEVQGAAPASLPQPPPEPGEVPLPPPAAQAPAPKWATALPRGPFRAQSRRLWLALAGAIGVAGALVGTCVVVSGRAGEAEPPPPAPPPEPEADAEPERDPSPPPPRTGQLVVKVRPSRAVIVVGEERVRAEDGLARLELPAGTHSVRVRAGGYRRQNHEVEVPAGGEAVLEVALERHRGVLTVRSRHRADVYVDGEKVGRTPLRRHEVPPGVHRVQVKSPRGERSVRVRVHAGRRRTVRFSL